MVACRAARDAGHAPPFRLRPGPRRRSAAVLRRARAAIRKTWTRSSGWPWACSSRARPTTAAPSAWCGRRASCLRRFASSNRGRRPLAPTSMPCARAWCRWRHRVRGATWSWRWATGRAIAMASGRPTGTCWRGCPVSSGSTSWSPMPRSPATCTNGCTICCPASTRCAPIRDTPPAEPLLLVPPDGALVHVARDREEEVAGFARRVKAAVRTGALARLDRAALVVRSPLPYVYVTREVLRSAGVPCQMFDALPLAAEPWAAAFDLVCSAVGTGFARGPAIALLGSPHFRFASDDGEPLAAGDVSALDRALAEHGYLGHLPALQALVAQWASKPGSKSRHARQLRAGQVLVRLATRARAAARPRPGSPITWTSCSRSSPPSRRRRAPTIRRARGSCGRAAPSSARWPAFATPTAASIRRPWSSTTPPPCAGAGSKPRPSRRCTGDRGVHLVDSASARFGDFDDVQLAGLVEGEWPDLSRRSIFYSPSVLRELGWPSDQLRLDGVRAQFADLLRLPASRLTVSTFALEADALVSTSSLARRAGAQRARGGGSAAGRPARVRARGARSRSGGRPRAGRGAARVGGAAACRGGPRRVALPRRDRGPSGAGLFPDGARALHGLSVQVLRG